jgi:hypothetical protein
MVTARGVIVMAGSGAVMPRLRALFLVDHFIVFNCDHHIKRRSAKMLAYGDSIFGNRSNFH